MAGLFVSVARRHVAIAGGSISSVAGRHVAGAGDCFY